MQNYKGIILAGGTGSRLWPVTRATSKQLMPVYDKPLIYYPLTTLMEAGLRDIAIITTPEDAADFQTLLGDGSQWGIRLTYIQQPTPAGVAQAYLLAEEFLAGAGSVLILGDNLFDAPALATDLRAAMKRRVGATIFAQPVPDPERFGVAYAAPCGTVKRLMEKPQNPTSNRAVTGIYVCDGRAPTWASWLKPSVRGELEIIDLLQLYLDAKLLTLRDLGRSDQSSWFDTGTHESLFQASDHVRSAMKQTGRVVGSPELTALRNDWITAEQFDNLLNPLKKSGYGQSVLAGAHSAETPAPQHARTPKPAQAA